MNYTYVLESLNDSKRYIGWTNNLDKRLDEHDRGMVESTKNRRPLKLIYFEACISRKDAVKREKYFKTGFGRRYLNNRLRDYYSSKSKVRGQP